jgi:hypothetical protein
VQGEPSSVASVAPTIPPQSGQISFADMFHPTQGQPLLRTSAKCNLRATQSFYAMSNLKNQPLPKLT